jgi:prolipoprotein diacylglyceryltransferase
VYGADITGTAFANALINLFPYMEGGVGGNMLMGHVYQPLFLYEATANFLGLIIIYFAAE